MHLITQVRTQTLLIKIYSSNKDFVLKVDPGVVEGMNDEQIRDLVFNQFGCHQVDISSVPGGYNVRSYAIY